MAEHKDSTVDIMIKFGERLKLLKQRGGSRDAQILLDWLKGDGLRNCGEGIFNFLTEIAERKEEPTRTTYETLCVEAVTALKDYKKGSSRVKIKKYIEGNNKIEIVAAPFRNALQKCVASGQLVQVGQSFKLPE